MADINVMNIPYMAAAWFSFSFE